MSHPSLFHVGQAVVCIDEWEPDDAGAETYRGPLPQRGPIYQVAAVVAETSTGLWFVRIEGFADAHFEQEGFAPVELLSYEALAELLSETLEPVTA